MTADIDIDVVMRCWNDAALLPRTLAGLARQRGVRLRLIAIDSASTDGSFELLAAARPAHLLRLEPGTYRSSRVLNQGLALTRTPLVALINSDAVLEQDDCLLRLAQALGADPRLAGVCAAQEVRHGASAMTRLDHDIAFARRHELGAGSAWLSLVCSLLRRDAWEALPFDERLTYAEDAVWSARIATLCWRTGMVAGAACEHSHDYGWKERYRRAYGDAAGLAALREQPPARTPLGGVLKPLAKRLARDGLRLARLGRPWQAALLPLHRWPQMLGAWHGARDGWAALRRGERQPVAGN